MITVEEILAHAQTIAADADIDVYDDCIRVTIENFIGFNSDWEEQFRDYEDPDAIDAFLSWLEANADFIDRCLYCDYHFGDVCVRVGYTSFDI